MKENTRTWLTVAGVTALLAFAALIYSLYPGIAGWLGVNRGNLGGGALAAMILWLVLRKRRPMSQRTRIVLGAAVAVGLLLGLVVFYIS